MQKKPNISIFSNYATYNNPIKQFFYNIIQFRKDIVVGIQRAKNGFGAKDAWNFDYYLCGVIAGGLDWLSKNSHGYPGNEEFPTYESWTKALQENANNIYAYMDIDEFKLPIEEQQKISNEMKKSLHWVADHIKNLWD